MSAQAVEPGLPETPELLEDHDAGAEQAPRQVEVRRNAAVSAVLGAAASGIAIAYLWRAVATAAPVDVLLCVGLGLLAVGLLRGLLDARTPLLVADELGVRVRLGSQWRGLPWEAIDRVVVKPRRGWWSDGRLMVTLYQVQRAIEGLDGRAVRQARLNQRMYGGALAVPLGLTTRVVGGVDGVSLGEQVAALSQGRTEVVTLLAEPGRVLRAGEGVDGVVDAGSDRAPDRHAGETGTATLAEPLLESRLVIEGDPSPEPDRRPRWLRRTAEQPQPDPEDADQQADESPAATSALGRRVADAVTPVSAPTTDGKVRAIAKLGDPVPPLVVGEYEPEPAYDPVIGPELAAARTRVGLSVDELSERTRIRPHVIESIEVDDFAPSGGDFYARGHIRTLARVLGKDPDPLLAHFDARYAEAPIGARRVFEAELATGPHGPVRGVSGGPNWALLIAAVLALVLVWSAVRLFAGDGEELIETPPPVLNGSAGLGNGYGRTHTTGPQPVATRIAAVNAGAGVEVRDGDGRLAFRGDLAIGQSRLLQVAPPVTVTTDNAGALQVSLNGRPQGPLGALDEAVTRVFQQPAQ